MWTSFISPLSPSYWPKRFLPTLLQWLSTVSCSEMKLGSNWRYSKNNYRFWIGFLERSSKMFRTINYGIKKETVFQGVHFEGDSCRGREGISWDFMYWFGGKSSRIALLAISLFLHFSHGAKTTWIWWWMREKDCTWVVQPLPGSTSDLPVCRSLGPELRGLPWRDLQGWVWFPCR